MQRGVQNYLSSIESRIGELRKIKEGTESFSTTTPMPRWKWNESKYLEPMHMEDMRNKLKPFLTKPKTRIYRKKMLKPVKKPET